MNVKNISVTKLMLIVIVVLLPGCGYNALQSQDESIKSSWAEVLNQYKRRADLIPSLVNVVKGYAAHEKETLDRVTSARAKVGTITVNADVIENEELMKKFQAAQGEMTSALSRLLAVSESYPDLKANQNFRDLQAQIEGTENRITVARQRYIDAVRVYNTTIRSFPSNLTAKFFGYSVRPTLTVENEAEIATPPQVQF